MKYKVGDKVRIVSKWTDGCNQNPHGLMDKWLGKVMTIRAIKGELYKMKEDIHEGLGGWCWNEATISRLVYNHKIVITTDGKETLARLYDGDKVIKKAVARCSPEDTFNFETGARIAFDRLVGEKPVEEKPKYYNGKVVCIGNALGNSRLYTVGKIYQFENGRFKNDSGTMTPALENRVVETFEDWENLTMSKFIEVVE